MRHLITGICLLLLQWADAQMLDKEIGSLANDLSSKIVRKNRKVLALMDFRNEEGKVTNLTKYIQEHIEDNLINAAGIEVMDRKHIDLLLSENKLQSQGLLDERLAKSASKWVRIDGWVIGEITGMGKELKIKLKVIDINNSQVFASTVSENIIDEKIAALSGLKNCKPCQGTGSVKTMSTCTDCEGKGGKSCGTCRGSGKAYIGLSRDMKRTCEKCDGKGKFPCRLCNDSGQIALIQTCNSCNGRGNTLH